MTTQLKFSCYERAEDAAGAFRLTFQCVESPSDREIFMDGASGELTLRHVKPEAAARFKPGSFFHVELSKSH